jgi:hypothetical protein
MPSPLHGDYPFPPDNPRFEQQHGGRPESDGYDPRYYPPQPVAYYQQHYGGVNYGSGSSDNSLPYVPSNQQPNNDDSSPHSSCYDGVHYGSNSNSNTSPRSDNIDSSDHSIYFDYGSHTNVEEREYADHYPPPQHPPSSDFCDPSENSAAAATHPGAVDHMHDGGDHWANQPTPIMSGGGGGETPSLDPAAQQQQQQQDEQEGPLASFAGDDSSGSIDSRSKGIRSSITPTPNISATQQGDNSNSEQQPQPTKLFARDEQEWQLRNQNESLHTVSEESNERGGVGSIR